MNFNLIITGFNNPRAKTVIARHLAHDPSISLQKAMNMVASPPFDYMKNLPAKDLEEQCNQLIKMGIHYKVEEVTITLHDSKEIAVQIPCDKDKIIIKAPPVEQKNTIPPAPSHHSQSSQTILIAPQIKQPEKSTLKIRITSIFAAIIVIAFFSGLLIIGNRPHIIKTADTSSLIKPSEKQNEEINKKKRGYSTYSISTKAKAESDAFVDSATSYRYDYRKAINFYKIALSFNRYNIQAWYGLIDTYNSMGLTAEKNAARAEMERLFGKTVFSITEIVEKSGMVLNAYRTEDNVYRVEYRSNRRSETELIQETFNIIQAMRPICECEAISLFASTSPGHGLMVYINKNVEMHSSDTYRKNASIQFLR